MSTDIIYNLGYKLHTTNHSDNFTHCGVGHKYLDINEASTSIKKPTFPQ